MYFAKLESNMTVTYLLYFGYMSVICLGIFLVTGLLLRTFLIYFKSYRITTYHIIRKLS